MFTATTEIRMIVNGKETFTIVNSPETGQWWKTDIGVDKLDFIQGQLALAEASNRLLTHKIQMDSKRVLESTDLVTKG